MAGAIAVHHERHREGRFLRLAGQVGRLEHHVALRLAEIVGRGGRRRARTRTARANTRYVAATVAGLV